MLDVSQAEKTIFNSIDSFGTETVPLEDALGGVLAQNIIAERDQPAFDRVTMDGIAIAYDDWQQGRRNFQVQATQGAGEPPQELQGQQCVEIMTGAALPTGADTIVPVERLEIIEGQAQVAPEYTPSRWQFVHRRGSDHPARSTLMQPGMVISAPEIAVLAGCGCPRVEIARRPKIAVISTGDELVGVEDPMESFQIRSTNDRAIEAALKRTGCASVTRVRLRDQPELLCKEIGALHDEHDLLVLSGGVSMGKYDYVPLVMKELDVTLVLHKVKQRPGLPMWFGISAERKPIFALPGNPVSTLVCLVRYVIPALAEAQGRLRLVTERVRLAEEVEFTPDLTYFLAVRLIWGKKGQCVAEPQRTNTSGDFVSLAGTDGFVELPRGSDLYPRGYAARLFRW